MNLKNKIIKHKLLVEYASYALILLLVTLVFIFVKPEFSRDFHSDYRVDLLYSSETDTNAVAEKAKEVGDYERLEKKNANQYEIYYSKIDKNVEEAEVVFSQIGGFSTYDVYKSNLISIDFGQMYMFATAFVGVLFLVIYISGSNIKKSRNKVAVAFAFFVQNIFTSLILLAVLFLLSKYSEITWEVIIVFAGILLTRVLVDMILVLKLNLAAGVHSQKDFVKFVREFIYKYDRNFVVVGLFSIVVFMPFMLIASSALSIVVLTFLYLGLNVWVETFVFDDMVSFFLYLIQKLPVVRNLKWTQR